MKVYYSGHIAVEIDLDPGEVPSPTDMMGIITRKLEGEAFYTSSMKEGTDGIIDSVEVIDLMVKDVEK